MVSINSVAPTLFTYEAALVPSTVIMFCVPTVLRPYTVMAVLSSTLKIRDWHHSPLPCESQLVFDQHCEGVWSNDEGEELTASEQ
jgi:hypothetical protein